MASNNEIRIVPPVVPKTDGQKRYVESIVRNKLTLALGPAGTGKTRCSIGIGAGLLHKNKINSIVITRPAVEACFEKIGYSPGSINEKMSPFMIPLMDELLYYYHPSDIKDLQKQDKLKILSLSYARGLNFINTFVVVDEAQNCTFEQLKMLLTRIGEGTKMVISGDISQSDLPFKRQGSLTYLMEKLNGLDGVGVVKLTTDDIVRSGFVAEILKRLAA